MRYLAIAILCLVLATPAIAEPTPEPAPAPAPEAAPGAELTKEERPENAFVAFDKLANHYKCYRVQQLFGTLLPAVTLSDQFKESHAQVIRPRYLCNPTKKDDTGIVDERLHYVCFDIVQEFDPVLPDVVTSNQFGEQRLRPTQTELLCLPSKKEHL